MKDKAENLYYEIHQCDHSKDAIELILKSFREMAEAQKEACRKKYKSDQAKNIAEKIKEANIVDYTGAFYDLSKSVQNTPLVTDNPTP